MVMPGKISIHCQFKSSMQYTACCLVLARCFIGIVQVDTENKNYIYTHTKKIYVD